MSASEARATPADDAASDVGTVSSLIKVASLLKPPHATRYVADVTQRFLRLGAYVFGPNLLDCFCKPTLRLHVYTLLLLSTLFF